MHRVPHISIDEVHRLMADNDSELDHTEGSSKHESFIEEPLRWCVVCGYILTGLTLAVLISSAWVLTPYLMQLYGQNQSTINLLTSVFFISPILLALPSSYCLAYLSLTVGMIVGLVCIILAVWLRSVIGQSFTLALAGHILGSFGVSFILAAPSQISARWFFPLHRPLATFLMTLSPLLFMLAMPYITLSFINMPPYPIPNNELAATKSRIQVYLKFESLFCTLIGGIAMMLFHEGPKHPPSHSEKQDRPGFCESLSLLFSNSAYLMTLLSCGLSLGAFNTMLLISPNLLKARGLDIYDVSLVYLVYIPVIIGCGMMVYFLYNFLKNIKPLLVAIYGILLVTGLLMLGNAPISKSSTSLVILLVFQAAFTGPILSLSMQFVAELTFPACRITINQIDEAISASLLISVTGLFTIFLTEGIRPLLGNENQNLCYVFLVLLQALVFLLSLFTKEKQKRNQTDNDDFILYSHMSGHAQPMPRSPIAQNFKV